MNSLLFENPVVPVLQIGTILKVNRHFENTYFKLVANDKDSYTLLECDALGNAVRCPQKAVVTRCHFAENFACGWWSVVSEPAKVSIAQKNNLTHIAKSIKALKSLLVRKEPKSIKAAFSDYDFARNLCKVLANKANEMSFDAFNHYYVETLILSAGNRGTAKYVTQFLGLKDNAQIDVIYNALRSKLF